MNKKSIMIDMDEVIVKSRFTDFLNEFLGVVDFEKLNGFIDKTLLKEKKKNSKKFINLKIYIKMMMEHLLNH